MQIDLPNNATSLLQRVDELMKFMSDTTQALRHFDKPVCIPTLEEMSEALASSLYDYPAH